MLTKIKFILPFLIALLLFSCTKEEKSKETSSKLNTELSSDLVATPKADRFHLRYKFKKNESFKYKITTLSKTNQQVEADSIISTVTEQTITYIVNLKVKDIDSKGNYIISWKINSIKSDGSINGEKISYDSKYIFSTQERMMFAQFEAIKGKTFTVRISKIGEILDIYNLNSIIDELIDIQKSKDKATKEIRAQLAKQFREAALLPLTEQIFRQFPEEPIGINSYWDKRFNTKFAMFDIENIASFEIKDVKNLETDSVVTISAGLSINWLGNHEATDQGIKYYFYDPVVSGSGLITFNKSKGLITHSETSTIMQQIMEMEGLDASQQLVKGKRTDNSSNKNTIKLLN